MDGVDLLKKVREDQDLKDIPFMLITAEAHKEKIIEAVKAGVDNYIVTPFTAESLQERLEKIAQRRPALNVKNSYVT